MAKLSQYVVVYGYRFSKESFCHLLNMIQGDLERSDNRGRPLPAVYQLLIALHFYCSGSYQVRVFYHCPSGNSFMTTYSCHISPQLKFYMMAYSCHPN